MKAFDRAASLSVIRAESIGDPAFVVDSFGVVTSWNQAATALFGRPAASVLGRRCAALRLGRLPGGELACTVDCPLIQGVGFEPGPPAVELAVRPGRWSFAASRNAYVQHLPLTDVIGRHSGILHVFVPVGALGTTGSEPVPAHGDELRADVPGLYFG